MKYQAENTVSSFFYYMWNAWSEEECKAVYGGMYPHFWEKWCVATDKGRHSARRNGSTWNSRKTTAGFWWNGPSRYMTDDTSEKEQ